MDQHRYEPDVPQKSRIDQAAEIGQQALDQATEAATVARDTVKEHPFTTLAVVGVLRSRSALCGSCGGRARPVVWMR